MGEPGTTIKGISFSIHNFISSRVSNVASPITILTILHLLTPLGLFFPSAIFIATSTLKDVYPPHLRSFDGLSIIKLKFY